MSGRVFVIGAGMAGLAAALSLSARGRRVVVCDAAPYAGGRARSYFDKALGTRIDNGNHLVLSGNAAVRRHLQRIGAESSVVMAAPARFTLHDVARGQKLSVTLSDGLFPAWIFDARARLPGTKAWDYLSLARLLWAAEDAVVSGWNHHPLYEVFLKPFCIATLNTEPEQASVRLLANILRGSLLRGGAACRAILPRAGLSESFVDPALAALQRAGAEVRLGARLRGLETAAGRVTQLLFDDGPVLLNAEDAIILAVNAPVAQELVPELRAPTEFRPIVNLHFAHDLTGRHYEILGMLNALAEWVFVKPGILSVTISAATHAVERAPDEIAPQVWAEICAALGLPALACPTYRVVKEKRATFAATPAQNRLRPGPRTQLPNLFLAGDWTETALPSTIEGALRSGERAAACLHERNGQKSTQTQ